MHNPPHPGLLLEDYLGDISIAEAARRLGILLGTSAELWLGMQTSYDLWPERQKPQPNVLPLAS